MILQDRLQERVLSDRLAAIVTGQEPPDLGAALARFDELLAEEPEQERLDPDQAALRRVLGVA